MFALFKLSYFNQALAQSFWRGNEVEWTANNSKGTAGGLVILWKRGFLNINFSFIDKDFVGININWKGNKYNLVNVYAPSSVVSKRDLWKKLEAWRLKNGSE